MCAPNSNDIKFLLDNFHEPLIFNNIIEWELLKWSLNQWNHVLKDEELQFRKGKICFTNEPQWERKTEIIKGKFSEFLNHQHKNEYNWLYFDYKYLKEWLLNQTNIRNAIKWDSFGFPNKTADESTIWIGNKGAHTPCHIDTYGFNLVAQIYGRKRWILFPPDTELEKSRIPYEESSIFSKLNFYSPRSEQFKGISKCRSIVLQPGQVLYVPNGWWHFVENLEVAISVNVWIPSAQDNDKRINEALVQTMMNLISKSVTPECRSEILNPNENFEQTTIFDSIKIVRDCLENMEALRVEQPRKKIKTANKECANQLAIHIFNKYKNYIDVIQELSTDEFYNLIQKQAERFTTNVDDNIKLSDLDNIINAFCDSDVIDLIKNKLVSR